MIKTDKQWIKARGVAATLEPGSPAEQRHWCVLTYTVYYCVNTQKWPKSHFLVLIRHAAIRLLVLPLCL